MFDYGMYISYTHHYKGGFDCVYFNSSLRFWFGGMHFFFGGGVNKRLSNILDVIQSFSHPCTRRKNSNNNSI